ncbi:hypothetical protein TYRP_016688 [Tyrophagus putrescentiae]|nr:hypothetical protein TYRP_016688 [Tyrophagus putrescentiae]
MKVVVVVLSRGTPPRKVFPFLLLICLLRTFKHDILTGTSAAVAVMMMMISRSIASDFSWKPFNQLLNDISSRLHAFSTLRYD